MNPNALYKKGEIKGNFEILDKIDSYRAEGGNTRSVYMVRCLVCGDPIALDTIQIRSRKDCGCVKPSRIATGKRVTMMSSDAMWMTEGEIYRAWKDSKDRNAAYKILAQLNDVPIDKIYRIIKNYDSGGVNK